MPMHLWQVILVIVILATAHQLESNAAIATTCINGKDQFFECKFILLVDLALGLLVQFVEIKFFIVLGDSLFSKEYLSEALPPRPGKELHLPELPIILLSTESNDLEVFLFNYAHLEVLALDNNQSGLLFDL